MKQKFVKLSWEDRAERALATAVRKAIAERVRLGLPVYVWANDRVVDMNSTRNKQAKRLSKKRS